MAMKPTIKTAKKPSTFGGSDKNSYVAIKDPMGKREVKGFSKGSPAPSTNMNVRGGVGEAIGSHSNHLTTSRGRGGFR
jgi:hypothetical protein